MIQVFIKKNDIYNEMKGVHIKYKYERDHLHSKSSILPFLE